MVAMRAENRPDVSPEETTSLDFVFLKETNAAWGSREDESTTEARRLKPRMICPQKDAEKEGI
jgi:hypothetical protein